MVSVRLQHHSPKAVEIILPLPCMESLKAAFNLKNVEVDAKRDAQRQHSRSHACSFVKSAVPNACVCLMELMATSNLVLVTMNGRLKEEAQNALEFQPLC